MSFNSRGAWSKLMQLVSRWDDVSNGAGHSKEAEAVGENISELLYFPLSGTSYRLEINSAESIELMTEGAHPMKVKRYTRLRFSADARSTEQSRVLSHHWRHIGYVIVTSHMDGRHVEFVYSGSFGEYGKARIREFFTQKH